VTTKKQPVRIKTVEINELNSAFAEWDIVDEQGQPVPLAAISAFTVDLYDDLTGAVINSRNAQSILNVNGGTYHATNGHVTFTFLSADNPIVGTWSRGHREGHTARFTLRWGASGRWDGEIKLRVANLQRVP
jgi:hypothetical protein